MKRWLLLLALCGAIELLGQELPSPTEQQVENLAEETPEDDALLQNLAYFKAHPLNLNTVLAEEWQGLRLLTDLQIGHFLAYRKRFGPLVSIYELQAVPGFDLATVRRLLPFVFVGPVVPVTQTLRQRFSGADQMVLFRTARQLEKSKGYNKDLPTYYLGDAFRLQLRYRYQHKTDLYYGLVADKDAGEAFGSSRGKLGFDFYSAHLFARNLGKVKAVSLGDYTVNLGQGLTQWQSLGFGKSADVINIKRQSPVLLPYRSAGEFLFNRGAAVTLGSGNWNSTLFFSYRNLTGNLDADSNSRRISSLSTSGYHRTQGELADRSSVNDQSVGGNLAYREEHWHIGVNGVIHRFSLPLQKADEPHNRFAFSGTVAANGSLDYSYTYNNVHLFGEAATDRKGNAAFLSGALISAGPNVDLSILYRNLSPRYRVLFGNAFTESSLPTNEQGLYTGIQVRPAGGWLLSAYADQYRFPFLRFRTAAPTRGWDYLAQLTHTPNKSTELYLRFRSENKPLNPSGSPAPMVSPEDHTKKSLRFQWVTTLWPALTLKGRTEMSWFNRGKPNAEEGFLSYLEGAYRANSRWKGNLRIQYFETDGFESRIYTYESDVLYSFSVPAYFDRGLRYYLNLNFEPTDGMQMALRLAQTVYAGRAIIGSGLDETQGNRRTEVKVHGIYKW